MGAEPPDLPSLREPGPLAGGGLGEAVGTWARAERKGEGRAEGRADAGSITGFFVWPWVVPASGRWACLGWPWSPAQEARNLERQKGGVWPQWTASGS